MRLKKTLRNSLGCLLAGVLILLGHVWRAKQQSLQAGVITSVNFHNPGEILFKKIVLWFKNNGYTFISCDQLIDILHKKATCPRGAVWLSLDDGWEDNKNNVIPTAIEFKIPLTFFICTGSVEDGAFWWREIREHTKHIPPQYRHPARLRQMPEDGRKQILELIKQMIEHIPSHREAMTIEDIRAISALSPVTIGSHTVSHPVLSNCTDRDIDYELGESRKKLEEWTGKTVKALAYPSGAFDDRALEWLKKHGYELAATTERRFAGVDSDCYRLPRCDVMDDGSFAENLCHALGIWEPVMRRLKGLIGRACKK
jgi:peptidoglycan/xylan/chitin deacetylase (PgdA/CDA1 family)